MNRKRVVYQDWIVQLGRDPDQAISSEDQPEFVSIETDDPNSISSESVRDPILEEKRDQELREAVEEALQKLDENEREFIRQFYLMGRPYLEISEKSGRAIYRLEAIHLRAVRKLKKILAPFVRERFNLKNLKPESGCETCPICQSEFRAEIDAIISNRDRKKTWRPVTKELREKFHIKIKSPQILIGHEKYH